MSVVFEYVLIFSGEIRFASKQEKSSVVLQYPLCTVVSLNFGPDYSLEHFFPNVA